MGLAGMDARIWHMRGGKLQPNRGAFDGFDEPALRHGTLNVTCKHCRTYNFVFVVQNLILLITKTRI